MINRKVDKSFWHRCGAIEEQPTCWTLQHSVIPTPKALVIKLDSYHSDGKNQRFFLVVLISPGTW